MGYPFLFFAGQPETGIFNRVPIRAMIRSALVVPLFILSFVVSAQVDNTGSGRAVQFDGVDDYINLGNVYDNLALPFTVSAWINLSSAAQTAPILPVRITLTCTTDYIFGDDYRHRHRLRGWAGKRRSVLSAWQIGDGTQSGWPMGSRSGGCSECTGHGHISEWSRCRRRVFGIH